MNSSADEPDSEEEQSDQSISDPPKRDFFKEADRQRALLATWSIPTEEEWEAHMLRNGFKRFYQDGKEEESTPE